MFHLESVYTLSSPTVVGSDIIVSKVRPHLGADAYTGQLWLVPGPHSDEEPRRWTRGFCDTKPATSPDGTLIAFLRSEPGGKPQLAIMDARGGEPLILTDEHMGITEFQWTPDSRQLIYGTRLAEEGRYGTVKEIGAGAESPRRITTQMYRSNGVGYTRDQPHAIYAIEVPDPAAEPWVKPVPTATTPIENTDEGKFPTPTLLSDADLHSIAVTSDAVFAAGPPSVDFDEGLQKTIVRIPRAEPHTAQPVAAHGNIDFHALHATESTLFALGVPVGESGTDFVGQDSNVYAADLAGAGDLQQVTSGTYYDALFPDAGDSVLALARRRGSIDLHRIHADGTIDRLVEENIEVTGAAVASTGVVVTYSDPQTPGEVAFLSPSGSLEPATTFGEDIETVHQRKLTVTGPDGYPIHGWIYEPENSPLASNGKVPVILNIHGGPHFAYGWNYFDEAQAYAAAGYAVIQCNPRGSSSYGFDHGRAIYGAMGTVDVEDILAFLAGVLADDDAGAGILDPERVGVMGGSYGGYMTAFLIGHEDRFKAAIVERGYLDTESFIGTSDIGWFFTEEYAGRDIETIRKASPMTYASNVRTPTLIIHSEEDLRCPIEAAERFYMVVRRTGTPVEMLIFPGENHELSRSGRPRHRQERFDAIIDWFGRHLA